MRTCFDFKFIFLLVFILSGRLAYPQSGDWIPLFNGKDLTGWKSLNGKAEYKVENGAIVGISVMNEPNSFLCTEKAYGDFILKLEVNVDPPLNSGIQFRSHSDKDYLNGRVHGYQCEIDPSRRSWSGGIYEEAGRGWLVNLSGNQKSQAAFLPGEWNKFRIEAIGDTIRTWINGVMGSDLVDENSSSGFIGLQVHMIGENADMAGKKVRWRNINILTSGLMNSRIPPDPDVMEINYVPNSLTPWESDHGWKLLWDGKTTKGWKSAKSDEFPQKGWSIENGVLTVQEGTGGESENGGDIITVNQYSNFILDVDFMITKGANSGIKYFVDPVLNKKAGSAIGLEYQLLDNLNHPDAREGVEGNRTLASLYDLIPAFNLTEGNSNIPFGGIETWNRARIIVRGNHVEHWLNYEKMVEYNRGSQTFKALVAKSKYNIWPGFGQAPQGNILLQDHGSEVHFRSIKIKVLSNSMQ